MCGNKSQNIFMKVNNTKLLTSLASLVGVTGASLLAALPGGAQERLNSNPSIFSEAPYNRSERVQLNPQYAPAAPEVSQDKQSKPEKPIPAPAPAGGSLNPNPSIKNECPFNRSACPAGGLPAKPKATPTVPGTPIPTTPTPTPIPTPESTPTPDTTVPVIPSPGTLSPVPTPEVSPTTTPETLPTPTPETTPTPTPTPTEPGAGTPSDGKNLLTVAEESGSFKVLLKALDAAGLKDKLKGNDQLTIFAPTDAAFAKLKPQDVKDLLDPKNKEVLVKLMTYHVVAGKIESKDLKSGQVKSLEGGAISVKLDDKKGVMVNDAKVVKPDIQASNGVIHGIDLVIIPPDI
jgi:uncharacterized surface protein with fasciclin (FAS1) repeats